MGQTQIKRHMERKHDINRPDKRFKCQYCTRAFESANAMRDHENTHTGDRPHMCRYCGKCFAFSGSLSNHMKFCTKTKPGT